MEPIYFESASVLRAWFERHHDATSELLVGFHKVHTKRESLSYHQALDEALCFGWIDGVRRGIDEARYTIRFTPRAAESHWSKVNLRRIEALIAARRVTAAGMAAYEARSRAEPDAYSYEKAPRELAPEYVRQMRANARAAAFFDAQAPSYRRVASFWVMSAKKEETRAKRLATLIEVSAKGEWLPQVRWTNKE